MTAKEVELELRLIRESLEKLLSRQGLKPVALRVPDAAWAIGMKLTKFKQLLRRGDIDSFTVDRVRLVRVAELERWCEAQSKQVALRFPRTRGRTEEEKILAKLRR